MIATFAILEALLIRVCVLQLSKPFGGVAAIEATATPFGADCGNALQGWAYITAGANTAQLGTLQ